MRLVKTSPSYQMDYTHKPIGLFEMIEDEVSFARGIEVALKGAEWIDDDERDGIRFLMREHIDRLITISKNAAAIAKDTRPKAVQS